MKLIALLIVVIMAGIALVGIEKKPEPSKPEPLYRSAGTIKVDGVLDEAAWKEAAIIDAVYVWGKVGERSKEPRMKGRFVWDDEYLYIGYETFDKNLVALGAGEQKGPKGNQAEVASIHDEKRPVDVVEFFLSFGDPQMFWEVHHNALNHFNDLLISVVDPKRPIAKSRLVFDGIHFGTRAVLEDDAESGHTRKFAARLKPKADGKPSTVNDNSDEDTGYVGELRLPWWGLGAPRERSTTKVIEEAGKKKTLRGPWEMKGQEMMILAVMQNGDLKEHYHHSSPTKPGGWFHKGTEHWPRYVLQEKK